MHASQWKCVRGGLQNVDPIVGWSVMTGHHISDYVIASFLDASFLDPPPLTGVNMSNRVDPVGREFSPKR